MRVIGKIIIWFIEQFEVFPFSYLQMLFSHKTGMLYYKVCACCSIWLGKIISVSCLCEFVTDLFI